MAVPRKARTTTKKNGNTSAAGNGKVTSIESAPHPAEDFSEQVRRRAYEIYLESGRPEGCAHDHWVQAEAEVRSRKTA
ncbi:MAG: DUF2934 domain-containing protein [Acidobacteria bacterium]|nr:DUF2934 domain-containing protein [Acidobacteriota bacterium]